MIIILIILLILIMRNYRSPDKLNQGPFIQLYLGEEKRVQKMPLEEYITGTVAAEMPASFATEALKAQAVCARTYALRKLLQKHEYPMKADLSDDINTCQAFISKEEFMRRHPRDSEVYWEKIVQAVQSTRGEIMVYQNEPIDALYHSTCGGQTESALEVWGNEVPYLHSVKCNYCRESNYFHSVQVFNWQELPGARGKNPDIKILEKSSTGRIKKIAINDQIISGSSLRARLGLPSTWWRLKIGQGKIIINSRGYGHGVGLCQYGANGMAQKGADYHVILNTYYQGIKTYKLKY